MLCCYISASDTSGLSETHRTASGLGTLRRPYPDPDSDRSFMFDRLLCAFDKDNRSVGFGNEPREVRSWVPGIMNGAPATKADNFRMPFLRSYKYQVVSRWWFLFLSLYTLSVYRAIHTLHRVVPTFSTHLLSTTTLKLFQHLSLPKSFIMMPPVMGRGGYNAPANRPCPKILSGQN